MNNKYLVVGAGLAGLATAYYLSAYGKVSLYDEAPLGRASTMAAGLLHPYAGLQCKLNRKGKEGISATLSLIKETEAEPSILYRGVYRLCSTELQEERCYLLSQTEDVKWLENEKIHSLFPFTEVKKGIYINDGYAIDVKKYLQFLWKACEKRGVKRVDSKNVPADKIIYCTGAWAPNVTQVKGQLLTMEWPESLPPLKAPIVGQAYIVPYGNQIVVGSTFEKGHTSEAPDIETAKKLIFPKLKPLVPQLEEKHILSCQASLRASTPDHMPLIKQLDERSFLFTGLGSKGLLYHALYAKMIVNLCQ